MIGMFGGAMLGTVGKTRAISSPQMQEPTKEEEERNRIRLSLFTTGPIPAEKLQLQLEHVGTGWKIGIDAESEDGKIATILEDARVLLRTLAGTGASVKMVSLHMYTSGLNDIYGKAMEHLLVARIGLSEATWRKADWSGFDPRNFAKVADDFWLHPLLQQQPLPKPRPDNAAMIGKGA